MLTAECARRATASDTVAAAEQRQLGVMTSADGPTLKMQPKLLSKKVFASATFIVKC